MIDSLYFFVEEESIVILLKSILHKVLPNNFSCHFIVFDGKQDLEKKLIKRLKNLKVPNSHVVVIRDQDREDCHIVKMRLQEKCKSAGKPETMIRVVCRELESFYLGDLKAVEVGLGIKGLAKKQENKKFRQPDQVQSPFKELELLTKKTYQKIAGSRAIAAHMDLAKNSSVSFNHLIQGIQRLVDQHSKP